MLTWSCTEESESARFPPGFDYWDMQEDREFMQQLQLTKTVTASSQASKPKEALLQNVEENDSDCEVSAGEHDNEVKNIEEYQRIHATIRMFAVRGNIDNLEVKDQENNV